MGPSLFASHLSKLVMEVALKPNIVIEIGRGGRVEILVFLRSRVLIFL